MKKMLIKSLIILFAIALLFVTTSNKSYAAGADDFISQGDSFLSAASQENVINEAALKSTSDTIYNILFTLGVVLSVAIGMVIGVQFIMGSVEDKAKIKETLVPYVIGVFVIFGAFTIWKIAVGIGNQVAPTPPATGESLVMHTIENENEYIVRA